ncbi:M64 family metallopeptidase, partial [Alistipes putredinis]|uniref:M64 family metallopeptidase n=1 Tax=Alistipes putredinis TaxID=28117 RepID=UPI003AAEF486
AYTVVDSGGKIVFHDFSLSGLTGLSAFLADHTGGSGVYESSDYSKDGEVTALQTATRGNGINIVLLGDAFSDRLIADGTYDGTMRKAMEHFFSEEPYKSFRDLFNVYAVNVVSKNEAYGSGAQTALDGFFGDGTHVGGNDDKCRQYAMKVPGITYDNIDDALIIVMMNRTYYAGTCYMYYPSSGDYGQGLSIAYFPLGTDDGMFGQLLHHEAGGHGFPKLADEYAYEEYGQIPWNEVQSAKQLEPYGWWRNIDFTGDVSQVKWNRFITDPRYAAEVLGAYEGADTYWSGVWRPTYNSIMRDKTGGFNAPSREAIYYRINKLAYGDAWAYDYETFVAWDAENRTGNAPIMLRTPMRKPRNFVPLHPPVVVKRSR